MDGNLRRLRIGIEDPDLFVDVIADMRQQFLCAGIAADDIAIEHGETLEEIGAELVAQIGKFGPRLARGGFDHADGFLPRILADAGIGTAMRQAGIGQHLLGEFGPAGAVEKTDQFRKDNAFHRNLRMLCCDVSASMQRLCRNEDRRIGR